ncbi:FAD dependent oxidoreductase/FAD binding domain/NAD(P)-binding Rossmann-like domain/C-terminal domain of alpha-glycerophosphate oxidase, putative [Angomonas deanei]|uniref:FAD dependent oxidoreductase/FAD binding domain/NAD(P)-binding Rossmann-like domain/C-terminal domain of alpha-glycerophosphate oxidase, putative n=1 Tax=Angomonas deanei TaxID=59799 RepID=A0A7G2C934_9TRYP|nr:FAD dependent oxidoreductase/FAD binding domain/NAD(P)-binding Rossmann-like domain/C-terminal domain of alpha-glycerophosphate oxidase, putative [Angomonas deanei]
MGRATRRFTFRVGVVAATAFSGYLAFERYKLRASAVSPVASPLPPRPRSVHWDSLCRSSEEPYDVLVIGGGVLGLYAAVEAAQRGLRTALVERSDFAAGSSSTAEPLVPGAFPFIQRAIRQRDLLWVRQAIRQWRACTTWRNVAPECMSNDVRTLLPGLHTAELVELLTSSLIAALISPLYGPFQLSLPVTRGQVEASLPELKGVKGGVVTRDYDLDGMKAAIALARTAEELGVTLLHYAPLLSISETQDGPTHLKARVQNELQKNAYADVYTKSVINCTGSAVDKVRNTFEKNHLCETPFAFERHYATSHLVVPRSKVFSVAVEGEKMTLPFGANSLQVASTLFSFNAATVVPWKDDCYLIGPSVSPFVLPLEGKTSSNGTMHSANGYKAQKERILSILHSCGVEVDASAILSCLSHVVPVVKHPKEVKWAGEIYYNSYYIDQYRKTGEAEPQPEEKRRSTTPYGLYHLYGGTRVLARVMAQEVVDRLVTETPLLEGKQHRESRSQYLKLSCPEVLRTSAANVSPVDRLTALVRDTYVEHLDDVVFRRTSVGYTSPAQALEALPFLAEVLATEKQWSESRKRSEIKYCTSLLREVAVH